MEKMLLGKCQKCEIVIYNIDLTESELKEFAADGLCSKCQKKKTLKEFDIDYFIQKFSKIPADQWTKASYKDKKGHYDALGHCGETDSKNPTTESLALEDIFQKADLRVSLVNDGECDKYKQATPKDRILTALNDIRGM